MKFVKILVYALLFVALAWIITAALLPKEYTVERSKDIAAPVPVIFNQIKNLKSHEAWSPWQEADPTTKNTYSGTDGSLGASMSWKGNESGEGTQTLKNIEEGKRVDFDLQFKVPFESKAENYFTLSPNENGTVKVTWGMKGNNEFITRPIMGLMMDMDQMIGKDFERGLTLLSEVANKVAAEAVTPAAVDTTVTVK